MWGRQSCRQARFRAVFFPASSEKSLPESRLATKSGIGQEWRLHVPLDFPIDYRYHRLSMFKKSASAPDLLPGTLEMMILRTLSRGPEHGYGIAAALKRLSEEVLQVGEGSLYPALQRLLVNGLVKG